MVQPWVSQISRASVESAESLPYFSSLTVCVLADLRQTVKMYFFKKKTNNGGVRNHVGQKEFQVKILKCQPAT